jgi:hypothetical protein
LIEEAKAIVSESPELLKLYKREQFKQSAKSGVQPEPDTIDRHPTRLTCPDSVSSKNACPFGSAGYPKKSGAPR